MLRRWPAFQLVMGEAWGCVGKLRVRNWDKWQSYRRDRGQPPWIKVHRRIMRDVEWVALTDAQRGQLVSIWLLAADHDGMIPDDPAVIKMLCFMEAEPDLTVLIEKGFLEVINSVASTWRHDDVGPASSWRQHDAPEAETEAEAETDSLPSRGDLPPRLKVTTGGKG